MHAHIFSPLLRLYIPCFVPVFFLFQLPLVLFFCSSILSVSPPFSVALYLSCRFPLAFFHVPPPSFSSPFFLPCLCLCPFSPVSQFFFCFPLFGCSLSLSSLPFPPRFCPFFPPFSPLVTFRSLAFIAREQSVSSNH